jgi:hypothetical protein
MSEQRAAEEAVVIEQSVSGLWAWECPGCWRGISLGSSDAALIEYRQHVGREHFGPEPSDA